MCGIVLRRVSSWLMQGMPLVILRRREPSSLHPTASISLLLRCLGCDGKREPVPETTSLFALLWRTRVIRLAHAASHVPSDTAGEHGTSTPVFVRPRGRAPTSESGVREHTLHFRCSSRTTRTRTNNKNAKMTTKAAMGGPQSAALRRTRSSPFQIR